MNNEQEESISNQLCSVMYCTYGYSLYNISILNFYGIYENHVIRIMLYISSNCGKATSFFPMGLCLLGVY